MIRRYATLLFALSLAGSALADPACEQPKDIAEFISAKAVPLAAERFDSIKTGMTVWQIVKHLGPAARDVGSGLFILEWQSTDGRVFRVGGPSLCKPPLYVRFANS